MDCKLINTITKIIIKNLTENEISKVVNLQKESFADMAIYSVTWSDFSLRNHIRIFPQGQLYAEFNGRLVGSCSSLIVSLKADYEDHTWSDITSMDHFQITTQMAIVCTGQTYLFILNFAIKALRQCCIMQGEIWR